jgi:uncharacterized protein YecA (UPF0149 family)
VLRLPLENIRYDLCEDDYRNATSVLSIERDNIEHYMTKPIVAEIMNHLLRDLPWEDGTYRRDTPEVGRNDPWPCGSGKKYKRCCGK